MSSKKSFSRWFLTTLAVSTCTAFSLELASGPTAEVTGDTSAKITWKTDVVSGTRVSYGTNPKLLTQKLEGPVSLEHRVEISGLQPGTTYHFTVGSARMLLGSGSFATTGKAAAPATVTAASRPAVAREVPVAKTAPVRQTQTPAPLPQPPPTRATWGSIDSLPDHFNRHGPDFHASSADDYAAQAWLFLQRAKRDALPMKWDDSDNTLRVWEARTHTFAAYDRRGRTRTFFKPSNPDYWNRQPGNLVKPSALPF